MKLVATCTDCSWGYVGNDQVDAADAFERHAHKERHHVDIRRTPMAPILTDSWVGGSNQES